MLPAVNPVLLKGKSQVAFDKLGLIFKKNHIPNVLAADTKKNYIFVAQYVSDSGNMHFQVYNKNCQETDSFVLSANNDKNELRVTKYLAFKNKVMRPRDIVMSPDQDMTFEQTLQTRPIIVRRIESLLQAAAEYIKKD